jgi:hypothetical protein
MGRKVNTHHYKKKVLSVLIFFHSGAGIGWMGQLDSNNTASSATTAPTVAEPPSTAPATAPATKTPLFTNILSQSTGPSPEYLQSLLNVNETLLVQSLAKTDTAKTTANISTPMLTPADEQLNSILTNSSPLITPQEDDTRDYIGNIHPGSGKIISSLSNDKQLELTPPNTTNAANHTLFQH